MIVLPLSLEMLAHVSLAHVTLILIDEHCFACAFIPIQLEVKVLKRKFTHLNESNTAGTAWFMVGLC